MECLLYGIDNCDTYHTHAQVHGHDTRGKDKIYVNFNRLTKTQKSPVHMSQVFLNKLPPEARGMNKNCLKSVIKRFLIEKSFYSINEFLSCDNFDLLK